MYQLYYQPFACSFAVHAALEKIGQPFDLHKINLANGDHKTEAFLAMNPQGQVPILKHGDMTMTQAAAILLQLSEMHPEAALMPEPNSEDRSAALQALFFLSNSVHPVFSRMFYPDRLSKESPKDVKAIAGEKIESLLEQYNQLFETQDFCSGNQAYAPDYYLFAMLNWLRMFNIGLDNYPNIKRFLGSMKALPEIQKTLQTEMMNMAA